MIFPDNEPPPLPADVPPEEVAAQQVLWNRIVTFMDALQTDYPDSKFCIMFCNRQLRHGFIRSNLTPEQIALLAYQH